MLLRSAALVLAIASAATLGLAGCKSDPPLDTVGSVDLTKFQGQWFEIAHLPRPTQVDCYGTTATYTLASDSSMTLVHQCYVGGPTGALRQMAANAVVKDKADTAKLAVDFGGFYGDYWVIDLGPQYEYAVVGHPSRDYLWILSRSQTLDTATLETLRQHAADKGFDVSKLEYTKQDGITPPPPPSDDVKAKTYGCGTQLASPVAPPAGVLAALGLFVVAAVARKKRHA